MLNLSILKIWQQPDATGNAKLSLIYKITIWHEREHWNKEDQGKNTSLN
jgi:hypothetical protein